MAKLAILDNLTRTINRTGLQLKKHSPEILVVAGVVGVVTSAVMACKATTKANPILEDAKDQIDNIHNCVEKGECVTKVEDEIKTVSYSEEDSKKDLTIVYTQTAVKFVRLYGPAVILGTASIAAILGGHNILRKRNVALAAAYTALDRGFKQYRGRVIERFGKELDHELRYNVKAKQVDEIVKNEDGTETVVTKTVNAVDPNTISDYARWFDEKCAGWTEDHEYNLMFLKDQQRYLQDRLEKKGHLFLNEVYDALGMDRTKAGQVVGWIYDKKHPIGDNFIDFGIYDAYDEAKRDFVRGTERIILLDFNVDGDILNLI